MPSTPKKGMEDLGKAVCPRCHNCGSFHRIYGRKLSNLKSVDREIGPACFKHSQEAKADMAIAKEIREQEG